MRRHLLVLATLAAAVLVPAARADHHDCGQPCGDPCAPAPACTQTIKVLEWQQTWVDEVRTTYKHECKEEQYTTYKCERVPVTKTREVTVYKHVTECVQEPRTYCVRVPVTEYKTEYKTCTRKVMVPETKCVTEEHTYCTYECVEKKPGFLARLCGKKKDPCACPEYEMKKVEHTCEVQVQKTRMVCKTVTECVPVTVPVCTYRMEQRTEMVTVNRTRCVPECKTETYTCWEERTVPCTETRTVTVCVPCQETVKVCKMVPVWVDKEVPAAPACHDCGHGCGGCDHGCGGCHHDCGGCAPACDPCPQPCGDPCGDPCAPAHTGCCH